MSGWVKPRVWDQMEYFYTNKTASRSSSNSRVVRVLRHFVFAEFLKYFVLSGRLWATTVGKGSMVCLVTRAKVEIKYYTFSILIKYSISPNGNRTHNRHANFRKLMPLRHDSLKSILCSINKSRYSKNSSILF